MTFEFQEKGHKYFLDGKPMTGVTTVLGVIAKPALIQWAADMAVGYIKDYQKSSEQEVVPQNILEEARKAHTKKKEAAGMKGTDTHSLVENYVKDCIEKNDGWAMEYLGDEKMLGNFGRWANDNKVQFLASEKKVYHGGKDRFYAGTLDFLCQIGEDVYVGDLKTSSGIYDRTYFAQCAAYQHALEYCEPELAKKIKGSIIVRIGKDGSFEEARSYAYQQDLEIFLAALTIYRANETYKQNYRAKST